MDLGPEMYKKRDLISSTCLKTNFKVENQLRLSKRLSGQDLGRYRCISQVKRPYKVKISKWEI